MPVHLTPAVVWMAILGNYYVEYVLLHMVRSISAI